jgi:transposase
MTAGPCVSLAKIRSIPEKPSSITLLGGPRRSLTSLVGRAVSGQPPIPSWAGLCPGNHQSAGKRKRGTPRKGNQHLKPLLVEAAWSAVRTNGRLRARYHRLVLRFGGYRNPVAKKKAIVATAHTLGMIIWNILANDTTYTDLGANFYDRRPDPQRETRRLIAKLEALGHTVTIHPAA